MKHKRIKHCKIINFYCSNLSKCTKESILHYNQVLTPKR